MIELLNLFLSSAMQTVVSLGYPGVLLAAFLENFFPPIPSEAIFPFVGFVASQGGIGIIPAVIAGSLGAVLGAFFWYGLGALLGRANLKLYVDRYGKYLRIRFSDIERAERWFERHDSPVVFFGRLIPLVRTFISVPAGFAGMSLARFAFYSFAGSLLWIGALTGAGFLLGGRWEEVSGWVGNYEVAVLAGLTLLLAVFVYRHLRRRKS